MSETTDHIVYSKNVIDFVTVAVELCAYLENDDSAERHVWIDKTTKLLSLLYVKALLLPETISLEEEMLETFVKEEDYARIASKVTAIMGEDDVFLEVFVEDMKYSDTPVSAFVSENIADIYQDVRNFISVYQYGLTDRMNDALYACVKNFRTYWGQKLVNVLRPLHTLLFSDATHSEENADLNEEDLWD